MIFVLSKRFFPFFNTFFWGALNDNMFRNALVIMITYQSGFSKGTASALSYLAMAALMLPQFPFSATAGQVADKYPQHKLFRWIKFAEILLMLLTFAAFCFYTIPAVCIPVLLVLLFFMGTQSAFYSPVKYAYIPRNMPEDLVRGNACVSAGTYLAILFGTILGNEVITLPFGAYVTGGLLVLIALIGYGAARFIPEQPSPQPDLRVDWNPVVSTKPIMKTIFHDFVLRHCVIGLSIFWMAGALYVSQLAGFCKEVIVAKESLVMIFTLLFSVGVALGSCLCSLVRKRFNVVRLVPVALILMALFTLDLFFASQTWSTPECALGVCDLAAIPRFYRFVADLILLAMCGGFYSVPLIALLQKTAKKEKMARVVAGNNIINAAMIGLGSICSAVLMFTGMIQVEGIFVIVACINFAAAIYLMRLKNCSV
ncbi:MAG: MFS transporter [Lentisphaeria bacterium]|nr:MFS transporter [Lentisphaeria bacterium]